MKLVTARALQPKYLFTCTDRTPQVTSGDKQCL